MLTTASRPIGVMDITYARERTAKPHLAFRLRVRAQVVARAVRQFGRTSPVRLLEVGAAEGRTLLEMADQIGQGEYVGVEYDEALLQAHPSLPANVKLIPGNAMSLPTDLGERCFDVVSLLAVLEHLPDPAAALLEARRMLQPGGLIVATCPNPFWDTAAGRLGLVSDEYHTERIDLRRLRELIESAGFEVLASRRFMWAPVAILPYVRIPVPPGLSLNIDRAIDRIPLLRGSCVNSYVIGRRPPETG